MVSITRAIAEKSRTIRLPIHIIEKLNKIKKVQRQLSQKLGSTPTVAELAAELGFSQKQVRDCLERAQLPLSLDLRVGDDEDTYLVEMLSDSGTTPEEYVMQSGLSNDLEQLMADLTPQQTEVLTLRYGLADGQPLTLAAIGKHLNLSRERVRQVENLALKQLRQHQGSAERLVDYY